MGWGLASGSRLERRTGTVIVTLRKFLDEKKKLMEKFPQENSPVEIQKLERLNQENLARFPIIICSIAVSANFTSRPSIQIQE